MKSTVDTAVPLKDIASVAVWEKVSVISALMVAILVGGFIGLVALIPFGVTAIDPGSAEGIGSMLGLIILLAIVIFAALFRIHHWRITIKTHKEPQYRIYELSAKTQDHEMLFQLQDAILTRAGIKGEPMHKKSNKLVPTYIASILVAFAIVAAMLLSHPEIFETKQTDDSVDKESVQSVENEPAIQPQDETIQRSPGYGQWAYDSEDAIESHKEYPDTTISEDLVGCWEFECATFNTGETISREDGVIAYFRVYPDNMYSYVEMSPSESASSGVWQVIDEQVILSSYDDNDERVVTLDGNIMYLEKSDKVVCYMKVSEQPDYEDGANAAGEDTSDDITDDSAFNFQNITGSWQDETGENYLFIGYSDESRRDARAYFTMAQGFETVLSTLDKDGAEGVVMDYAGEIAFQIDISGYKYWLEVTLQDADTGETHYLKYYPADMESCPYYNPYYLDT